MRITLATILAIAPLAGPSCVMAQNGVQLVSNEADRSVLFLDATTGRVLGRAPTPKGPHEITVSHDGKLAYVADPGGGPGSEPGNSIVVLDTIPTRTVRAVYPVCERPHDSRLSPDGSKLWVACAPEKAIVELDARSGRILRRLPTPADGGWFVEALPNTTRLYTPHLEGKMLSVTEITSEISHQVFSGTTQFGVAASPNGKEIWVSDADEGKLVVVDATSNKTVGAVALPAAIAADGTRAPAFARLRFTPDGRAVGVVVGTKFLLVDARRRAILWSVEMPYAGKVLALSGDARFAFVSHPENNAVSRIDLRARKVVQQFPTGKQPDGLAWVSRAQPVK